MRNRRPILALLGIVLVLGLLSGANAQQEPAPAEKMYDLKFSSAPLDQVLTFYSDLTGRTRLESPNIKASITLRSQNKLTREETLQAIKAVLAMNGVGLVEIGANFVKVVPIASVGTEGAAIRSDVTNRIDADVIVSEIVRLQNIDANEALKAISGMVHSYGKIQPLERINSLMILETELNINRMLEIIKRIDQPTEKLEQYVYTNRYVKASEIKAKLLELFSEIKGQDKQSTPTVAQPRAFGPPGVIRAPRPATTTTPVVAGGEDTEESKLIRGDVRIVADDRSGILIIITLRDNFPFFEKIIRSFDVPVDPEVGVRVFPLEYAEADKVGEMLNTLIGAAQSKESGSAAKTGTTPKTVDATSIPTQPPAAVEGHNAAVDNFLRQQRAESTISAKASDEIRFRVGELSSQNIKILPDKRSNTLIIMATNRDMATLEQIIKSIDIMLSQVLIEAVILSVNLDDRTGTGIDWFQRSLVAYNNKGDGSKKAISSFAGGTKTSSSLLPLDATSLSLMPSTGGDGLTYYFTYFGLNMDIVVNIVSTDSRSRILSSPVIMTTDNEEAKIDVSTERYFYQGVKYIGISGSTGQQAAPDVQMKRVGLNLTVKPHINQKKIVAMEIKQKIDNVIEKGQKIDGQDWPTINSREFGASISVRSGETIILGGLAEESNEQSKSKIPILGDIPLIRLLFSSASTHNIRTEILVFITPHVLDTPEEIDTEARRRQLSMGKDGKWERTWSNSKLASDPPESKKKSSNKIDQAERTLLEEAGATNTPSAKKVK